MLNATVGIWDQLRTFFFARQASFSPISTVGLSLDHEIVGALSIRRNELQIDGFTPPRFIATSASEFVEEQYRLLRCTWELPSRELGRDEAEREEFALHALAPDQAKRTLRLDADLHGDCFCLAHPDLRLGNIIVDDKLQICGLIDWEFSETVPPQVFLPPPWLTVLDTGSTGSKLNLPFEFMSALVSRKDLSPSHSQLAQDWDFRDQISLPMVHIYLDPSNLVLLFYRHIYPRLYDEPRDKVVATFFRRAENKALQANVEQRLRASKLYTRYLGDKNLFDKDETEWQRLREWTESTQKKLHQLDEWSNQVQCKLSHLDGERAKQGGQESQA